MKMTQGYTNVHTWKSIFGETWNFSETLDIDIEQQTTDLSPYLSHLQINVLVLVSTEKGN